MTPEPKPVDTIKVLQTPSGNILVDSQDRTLYFTISDKPDFSNLPDELLSAWPTFYASTISVSASLNAADFGIYVRDNEVKQTTFKGYPLYYFYEDKAPFDTRGNKLGGVWFVVDPTQFPP